MPQLPVAPDLTALLDAREARAAQLHALQLRAMQRQMGRADKAYANRGNPSNEGAASQFAHEKNMQNQAGDLAAFRDNQNTYATPENYSREEVNQQGVPITVMDQSRVPTFLQGKFPSGIQARPGFGHVPGAQQYQVGLQRQGGQAGGSMSPVNASIGPGGEGNVTPPPDERSDWLGTRLRMQEQAMRQR
jgi:hypothetical protein